MSAIKISARDFEFLCSLTLDAFREVNGQPQTHTHRQRQTQRQSDGKAAERWTARSRRCRDALVPVVDSCVGQIGHCEWTNRTMTCTARREKEAFIRENAG